MFNVNDIKNGMTILFEDNIYTVLEFSHVKPGKGAAFVPADRLDAGVFSFGGHTLRGELDEG